MSTFQVILLLGGGSIVMLIFAIQCILYTKEVAIKKAFLPKSEDILKEYNQLKKRNLNLRHHHSSVFLPFKTAKIAKTVARKVRHASFRTAKATAQWAQKTTARKPPEPIHQTQRTRNNQRTISGRRIPENYTIGRHSNIAHKTYNTPANIARYSNGYNLHGSDVFGQTESTSYMKTEKSNPPEIAPNFSNDSIHSTDSIMTAYSSDVPLSANAKKATPKKNAVRNTPQDIRSLNLDLFLEDTDPLLPQTANFHNTQIAATKQDKPVTQPPTYNRGAPKDRAAVSQQEPQPYDNLSIASHYRVREALESIPVAQNIPKGPPMWQKVSNFIVRNLKDVLKVPTEKHPQSSQQEPSCDYVAVAEEDEAIQHNATPSGILDEMIDCIAHISFSQPVRGQRILAYSLRPIKHRYTIIEGLNSQGEWQDIEFEETYDSIRCGILLANGHNSLDDIIYSEWLFAVKQVAKGLAGTLEPPSSLGKVYADAKRWFTFIKEHNQELVLTLAPSKQLFDLKSLVNFLKSYNFNKKSETIYEKTVNGGFFRAELKIAANSREVQAVFFSQSLALCKNPLLTFEQLRSISLNFTDTFGAILVDDKGLALGPKHMAYIRNEIEKHSKNMATAGIPAGSSRALRMFL